MQAQARKTILLTGATGLIGSEVLHRLLVWRDDVDVLVAVRAPSPLHAGYRVKHLLSGLFAEDGLPEAVSERVQPLRVDLGRPDLGLDPLTRGALRERVTHVMHVAASVRTDLPLEALRASNVEATRHLLDLVHAASGFVRFHHVSTIGVAGRQTGVMPEAPLSPPAFNNDYERSKWEAERVVLERSGEVPVSVHRLSQIFGDSRTGWTPHFRMSYLFARLVLSGALPLLPWTEGAMTDAVTSDYAADALYALMLGPQPESGAIFHEVAGDEAVTVQSWVHAILERVAPLLAEHGLTMPRVELVSPQEFERWRASEGDRDPTTRASLSQVEGLIPHLLLPPRRFDDRRTLASLRPMKVEKRIPFGNRSIDGYAIRSGWGVRPEPRPRLGGPAPTLPG